jgi:hypothetical protein
MDLIKFDGGAFSLANFGVRNHITSFIIDHEVTQVPLVVIKMRFMSVIAFPNF